MMRMAMKTHTFSDGTTVPPGTIVGIPSEPTQQDTSLYADAMEFDPTRYLKKDENGDGGQLFTTTGYEFCAFSAALSSYVANMNCSHPVLFGGGKHGTWSSFWWYVRRLSISQPALAASLQAMRSRIYFAI